MRRRCLLGSKGMKPAYANIEVCERWQEYSNFLEDMGERPEGKTLDRVDPLKGYNPENCRWATPSQQQRNKRNTRVLTFNGVTKPLEDWAEEVGLGSQTLYKRVTEYGWDPGKALFTSPYENHEEASKNNGKQKDYFCPCCGLLGNKGNLVQHLRSSKNSCSGEPMKLT